MTDDEGGSVGVGSVLGGRWKILSILGEGGTATVYRASDDEGKIVAVKVLRSDLGRDAGMRRRFSREVNVANQIRHPAVVAVLGDGATDDGSLFLVMELLRGETLEARWERKGCRLPVHEVLWVTDQLLGALALAHESGILHRDIKPENLFLTEENRLKILDFGLARMRDIESEQGRTQMGFVMGTPGFLPPEQAQGQWDRVSARTDLWSVGATMFFLLTGRTVHEGTEVTEVVFKATSTPAPALRSYAPELPEPLGALIDRALAFDLTERWPDALAMQQALRELSAGQPGLAGLADGGEVPPPPFSEKIALEAAPPSSSTPSADTLPQGLPAPHGREDAPTAPPSAPSAQAPAAQAPGSASALAVFFGVLVVVLALLLLLGRFLPRS